MHKRILRGAKALAEYTGFSENAIHILVARGVLPVRRHGRLLIFLTDEIDQFFSQLPGVTADSALRAVADRARPSSEPRPDDDNSSVA